MKPAWQEDSVPTFDETIPNELHAIQEKAYDDLPDQISPTDVGRTDREKRKFGLAQDGLGNTSRTDVMGEIARMLAQKKRDVLERSTVYDLCDGITTGLDELQQDLANGLARQAEDTND